MGKQVINSAETDNRRTQVEQRSEKYILVQTVQGRDRERERQTDRETETRESERQRERQRDNSLLDARACSHKE